MRGQRQRLKGERMGWEEFRKGFFIWIPLDCRSLRSPRLCVSKKILGTGKRRGAEERGGCAVGEKDWRGGGWDGRSSGRDFLFGFLSIADLCALRVSAFQRRSWGPLNAEGARSGREIGGEEGPMCSKLRTCPSAPRWRVPEASNIEPRTGRAHR